MKPLLLALLFFFSYSAHGTEIFSLSSDKEEYEVGEDPVLIASVTTKPIHAELEFDVVGELNAEPLPVERVTDFEFSSVAPNVEEGSYVWTAVLVIQDKRYARDLKASITYFLDQIATIDEQLLEETDPEEITQLEAQKARYISLKAAAESELTSIRTPVKTLSLEFSVQ